MYRNGSAVRVGLLAGLVLVTGVLVASIPGCSSGGGVADLVVSLTLSRASVQVGQEATATARVTQGGAPQANRTVMFTLGTPGVATLSAASAVTDATGSATVTLTGSSAGTTTVTASCGGASSAPATLTVTPDERVLFYSYDDSRYYLAPNVPNAAASQADLGGAGRQPFGYQRGGSRVLIANDTNDQFWVRDLATGTDAAFAPGHAPYVQANAAGITPDGAHVAYLAQGSSSGNAGIMVCDADGGNEIEVYAADDAGSEPGQLSISPDGTRIAFFTADSVRVVRLSGGGADDVNIGTSGEGGISALTWLSNDTLAIGCYNINRSGLPGLLRASTDPGTAPTILFDDRGAGMRAAPNSMTTDGAGNVIFDEPSADMEQHELYRLDAPGYTTRIGIVVRPASDAWPVLLRIR